MFNQIIQYKTMIIAKKQNQEVVENGYYELFQPATMTGVDGEDVQVLQSIGTYSKEQLLQEISQYESMIASVQDKIDAINELEN